MMMLSGINVFKSTLFLVWAEVLLHLEHDMKFTSGKSSLQTYLADVVIKTSPHYAIPFCVLHLQRSNTQIYRMNVFFFFTKGGYLNFKTTYKYESMPCYS